MAKKQRWVLRFAADIDGGLTTANQALDALTDIRKYLEQEYAVDDFRGMCAPMTESQKKAAAP